MAVDYKSYLQQLWEADLRGAASGESDRSLVEQALDQLQAHEHSEHDLLEEYRYAANFAPDAGVRFLMSLILEDEERHHRLMAAMAEAVRSSLLWLKDDDSLPAIDATGSTRDRLARQAARFEKLEAEAAVDLKELRRVIKPLRSRLLDLLVDAMERDTSKHSAILKHIAKELEGR